MSKMTKCRLLCLTAALVALLALPNTAMLAETTVHAGDMQITVADSGFLSGLQAIAPMAGNQLLTANLVIRTPEGAKEVNNLGQLLLAVDDAGRVYTPILFNGDSAFTASLAPGERAVRVLFEVPIAAANYQLAVLAGEDGEVAGKLGLGQSTGPVSPEAGPLATIAGDGYNAEIYGVSQAKEAFLDKAPEGMKYVLMDAAFTGAGTAKTISDLVFQWHLVPGDGKDITGVLPLRAGNLLAMTGARFSAQLPTVRGLICFLVPTDLNELNGLMAGQTAFSQPLPISGDLKSSAFAALEADGAYHQAGWKVTVHGMRLADKGKLADPPSGSKYVIVNLTVNNGSTQNLLVSSELAFAMTDAQGNELTQAWFADLAETMDSSLLPGESVTGEVAFLLPDGAKAGTLRVHLNMLGQPLLIDAAGYLAV